MNSIDRRIFICDWNRTYPNHLHHKCSLHMHWRHVLSNCKLFFVIMNFNEHHWRYHWNTISIGSYPTLCWNLEHTHWHLTVRSSYVFDNDASLERRYVLISVSHVYLSLVLSFNAAVGISIFTLPNTLVNFYCNILVHRGRNWVGMNLQIDSTNLSWTSVSFKINQIKSHQATFASLFYILLVK